MTIYEALNILKISGSYTENDLKKAYHDLAKKYHPDNFQDEKEREIAEEKLKSINAAYELLLNNINKSGDFGNHSYYHETYAEVLNYKNTKLYELKKYQAKKYKNILFYGYGLFIDLEIFLFKTNEYNTVDEVNNNYQKALNNIIDLFKELQKDFYQKHNIDENEVRTAINYDCSLDEFYEQLLKIKEKYSINLESIFAKYAEKITNKYKNYAGYNLAKVEINEIMKRRFNKAKEQINDSSNSEEVSEQLATAFFTVDKEILHAIEQAIKLRNKIDSLFSKITAANDRELTLEYVSIKITLEEGTTILPALERVDQLETMIKIKNNSSGLIKYILNKFNQDIASEKLNAKFTFEYYTAILDYASNLHKLSSIINIISLLNNKLYDIIIDEIKIAILNNKKSKKFSDENDSKYKRN